MNLVALLDMAATGNGERIAFGPLADGVSYGALRDLVARAAGEIGRSGAPALIYLGPNHLSFPVALFASAWAGVPFVPLNYRLGDEQMAELVGRHPGALVLCDERGAQRLGGTARTVDRQSWLAGCAAADPRPDDWSSDPEAVAVLLYTSGTTSAPKAAVLRHRHLTSYVLGSVDFASAGPGDASLVAVPPYHIAGVSNVLSNVFAGRRVVQLDTFEPRSWVELVNRESITHAMVVPTMLARIVDELEADPALELPSLRAVAYGGAVTPAPVVERSIARLPHVDLVNAYGLTETSSTIAVLGPAEHRAAASSDDPAARARLGSVGLPVPSVEIKVTDEDGRAVPAGVTGLVHVRGAQVSGEYVGGAATLVDGWLPTRDVGYLDADGYLFVLGRSDDTIIRGGENIAPEEIEACLLRHPAVADAAVVGLPDDEWGQRIGAVVVARPGTPIDPDELRSFARDRLRSSKAPDEIVVWDELPRTDTGKLLRRLVRQQLSSAPID